MSLVKHTEKAPVTTWHAVLATVAAVTAWRAVFCFNRVPRPSTCRRVRPSSRRPAGPLSTSEIRGSSASRGKWRFLYCGDGEARTRPWQSPVSWRSGDRM